MSIPNPTGVPASEADELWTDYKRTSIHKSDLEREQSARKLWQYAKGLETEAAALRSRLEGMRGGLERITNHFDMDGEGDKPLGILYRDWKNLALEMAVEARAVLALLGKGE